jgi:hypothetical protein
MKGNLILITVIIIVAVGASLLILSKVGGVTGYGIANCHTETYQEQEPYTDQECQQVPYLDTKCEQKKLSYKVEGVWCISCEPLCYNSILHFYTTPEYRVKITNLDTEYGGTFSINLGFYDSEGVFRAVQRSTYLQPSSSAELVTSDVSVIGFGSCAWKEISVPTKQVCTQFTNYRQDCNSVTKYRTVTKTKEVCY